MPVQECSVEDKPGYQWGESGKCYTYTPGNDESRKEAKRKAYVQGYAIGELTEMEIHEWIPAETELATIVDVPIIHAGTFHPHNSDMAFEVTEEDLDDIVEGSTILQPIIQEAIHTGVYRGNEDITKRLSKPIPGLINIKHQQPFPDKELSEKFNTWMKDAVQGVTVSFEKKLIDGKNWVVKRFHNVKEGVAQTLQQQFPFRSSEFLPLTDPNTGKHYAKVERSTAFLDILTPPAVGGQRPELVVEFMGNNEPLTIITTTGVSNMAEKKEEKSVDVSELQKVQEALTAQTKALAELQAKFEQSEKDREKAIELAKQQEAEKEEVTKEVAELQAIKTEVQELRAKNEELDSDKLINHLSRFRKVGDQTFQVSPAYKDIVEPIIRKNGVVELAEGQSYRQAMEGVFDEIAELASKDALLIPLTKQDERSYTRDDDKPKDFDEEVHELMAAENLDIGTAIEHVTAKYRTQKEA